MSYLQSPKGGAGSGATPSAQSTDVPEHLLPGALVFAKMKSFPPWPAKVVSADDYPGSVPRHQVPVHFLGSGDFGHVSVKECFPYAEYRDQYGTPKQRPKHAEAIREAEELLSSQRKQKQQQPAKKRPAPKGRDQEKTVEAPPPAKKARGKATKEKTVVESGKRSASQPTTSRHDEELLTREKLLPASELAEIAASTVFEQDSHATIPLGDDTRKQPSPTRGPTDEDDEFVDDAISNVVRQLEELEKQEADEQRRRLVRSPTATEAKRRGGRPKKGHTVGTTPSSMEPVPTNTELAKETPGRSSHKRSMSETTDDGRGAAAIDFYRQSSGSETPLSGGEGGALGKRRHKPKVMADYFLEKDYSIPRSHKKSESSIAPPTSATPTPSKGQQQKTPKTPPVAKISLARGKKTSASGSKATKDEEKAALEAEIERVKSAAKENPAEQHASTEQQFWHRQDAFPDMPFDDSMFEVTVDVEEAPPSGGIGAHASFGREAPTSSQAAAKRKKDAEALAREKERQKQKEKLKVKFLKGLLPLPKGATSTAAGQKKKKTSVAAAALAKKKAIAGKMKVQIAKKRATKAAKFIAAAESKEKKKRGPKSTATVEKPKHEKRISGYVLWAERQIPILQQERPDLKKRREMRDILKPQYDQLPTPQKQVWEFMAKREKEKRKAESESASKKDSGQQNKLLSPAGASPVFVGDGKTFYGRLAGATASSPHGSRMFVMAPQHGEASGFDLQQQQVQLGYDQGAVLSDQDAAYQISLPESAYGNVNDSNAPNAYISGFGVDGQPQYSQAPVTTATPAKRPRGRPPKNPPSAEQPPKIKRPRGRPPGSTKKQPGAAATGFRPLAPLPKGLKIPKREGAMAGKQKKGSLKILTAGQQRTPFLERSHTGMLHRQTQAMLSGRMDEPPVPEPMGQEELVYDSETAAMAAAAAMGIGNTGIVTEDGIPLSYVDHPRGHHEGVGEETEAAVSYLISDDQASSQLEDPSAEGHPEDGRGAKKESKRRGRPKQKTPKDPKKGGVRLQQTPPIPGRGQKRNIIAAGQYDNQQGAFEDEELIPAPAAFEDAYVEPRPTEEETNMFFFGTTQDVAALLEVRNPPAAMEGQCRWWLAEEPDPDLLGGKGRGRGQSPPRALTAEPLDAAAVFKLIGRTFENVGNQLLREEGEDTPHELAAGLDMLLDGLVSSISHLLTLTGSVPPFDHRYRRDVAARLVEDTSMIIPL